MMEMHLLKFPFPSPAPPPSTISMGAGLSFPPEKQCSQRAPPPQCQHPEACLEGWFSGLTSHLLTQSPGSRPHPHDGREEGLTLLVGEGGKK